MLHRHCKTLLYPCRTPHFYESTAPYQRRLSIRIGLCTCNSSARISSTSANTRTSNSYFYITIQQKYRFMLFIFDLCPSPVLPKTLYPAPAADKALSVYVFHLSSPVRRQYRIWRIRISFQEMQGFINDILFFRRHSNFFQHFL